VGYDATLCEKSRERGDSQISIVFA
jgi:hypothetical protein